MGRNYSSILLDISEGIATITLNRPDRLNAFTEAMHADLREALAEVERSDDARVLVLTGAGRAFSAGQDLGEAAGAARAGGFDGARTLEENYNPLLVRLRSLPVPVIAAVNGIAAGAAANIALGCDIVVAARSASFLQAFAKIGLVPDAGGTYVLPRLVGLPRALGLALTAEPLPAATAAEWGLIWKCVDDAAFPGEVRALATHFASGPTRAYALVKEAFHASLDSDYRVQLDREVRLQREATATEDSREGIAAFLEKRAPRFKGR